MNLEDLGKRAASLLKGPWRNPHPVVGVLRLEGVIGGGRPGRSGLTLAAYEAPLRKLFETKNLKAAAVVVNSPGGSPVQSALIARRIRDLAEEKEVPVVAFCEDLAVSGGYWLACAGEEIFADASSIVGSVGVIFAGFGFANLLERIGVERRVHVTGERKAMLDPFRDEKEADVERLGELHAEILENFRLHVRERRGDRLLIDDETLLTADVWTGRRAAELGLIDGLGEMRSEMRRRFGEKVRFRRFAVRQSFLTRFRRGVAFDPGEFVAALDEWALRQRFRP